MFLQTLTITKIINVTENTKCFYFGVDDDFKYTPGQYITLVLNINGREVRRPYSLSSTPNIDEHPFITVKLIENGEATRFLHEKVNVGQKLNFIPSHGRFVLPRQLPKQLVFLAAGSGISPIFALIKQALYHTTTELILLYSNSSMAQTIFYNELESLRNEFPNRFKITYYFSNAKNLAQARLSRLNLEEFIGLMIDEPKQTLYFTCAPFVYMEMVQITLLTMGIAANNIIKETFFLPEEDDDDEGSLVAEKEALTYTDSQVTLITANQNYTFEVKAHQTILQAAKQNNVPLNYSCGRGMCSTCICSVTEGSAHMTYNQILTDNEVSAGRILTCTAHARTPYITIKNT